jgi:uncharacterized protein DUF4082
MVSIFTTETPTGTNNSDGAPGITVGEKFTTSVTGSVTGMRWFCTLNTNGVWTGSLWQVTAADSAPAGTKLATGTYVGTPASGTWNTITFGSPVTIVPGVTYMVTYFSGDGRYVNSGGIFTAPITNTPLTAIQDNTTVNGLLLNNGSYAINSSETYPNSSFNKTNYFADVLFTPSASTINKDTSFTWNVYNAVTKDTSFTWRVLNSVNKDTSFTWRVLNALTKDTSFTWRVLNALTKDVSFTWNVYNAIQKNVPFSWNVYNAVNKDTSFTWDVLAGTHVNKDVSFSWNVYNAQVKDTSFSWRVLNLVNKDTTFTWNVQSGTSATKDVSFTWRVFNAIQKNQAFTWNVLGASSITVTVWNGTQEVSVGSVAVWSGVVELPASITSIV